MDLATLQDIIERTYGTRDRSRGVPSSVAWLAEEIGELAQAVRKGTVEQQRHEFADVLAWVATLANQMGIDLNEAIERYAAGCPRCGTSPCTCRHPNDNICFFAPTIMCFGQVIYNLVKSNRYKISKLHFHNGFIAIYR